MDGWVVGVDGGLCSIRLGQRMAGVQSSMLMLLGPMGYMLHTALMTLCTYHSCRMLFHHTIWDSHTACCLLLLQKDVSHVSHMGGMLCGLFPAFLFLPRLQSERWEALLPLLGILVMLGVFAALPVYLYKVVLPPLPALCGV